MLFRTDVHITPLKQTIAYGEGILFLGSCFADEVGGICRGLGFNAQVNPFGVLYNPLSIANALQRLHDGKPFTHEEVIRTGEEFYCTFSHNTEFWSHTEADLLERVNQSLKETHEHFQKAKWIVVSLGTVWVYRYRETQTVVANCHKLPAQLFDRYCLSVEDTAACLSNLMQAFPDKQFIFTVSPLRHLKDGLHGNQLSKSTLLLAVNQVCELFKNAHYFPAYEILLDELRDYRFYKEDMVHPTEQAVRYIWEKFVEFAINPSETPAMQAASELKQMLHHKPLFPDSEAYRRFEEKKSQKEAELHQNHPQVVVKNLFA
ncbi:MAG: GSCFA domain-containing protein [Bacteroidales bacterium]|nr:GSCFA domain-containing protein [Bacteroidales bacterium]